MAVHEEEDWGHRGPLSEQELERALERLRHPHPVALSYSELEATRELIRSIDPVIMKAMLTEWDYKNRQQDEFRKKWPLIAAAGSLVFGAVTVVISIIVNFFQGGGHR